jgi:hypothetical protein
MVQCSIIWSMLGTHHLWLSCHMPVVRRKKSAVGQGTRLAAEDKAVSDRAPIGASAIAKACASTAPS